LHGSGVLLGSLTTAGVARAWPLAAGSELAPDPNRKLKFGLIGIGARCRQHIERINDRKSCEILAICDIREDRLDDGLEICRGKPTTYLDYRKLLKHAGINAVLIATPHDLHAPMSIDALDSGCDVMVEKPMGMTVAQCEKMNAAATRNNRVLMVAEQHRYFATNRKVKELIDAGEIGTVRCISSPSFRGPWSSGKPWLKYLATSGGGLLAESCHDLDAFHWIVGSRAVRVAGFGGTNIYPDQDTLDNAQLVYEFENGATLTFGYGTFVPGGYRGIAIIGTHGRLEYERYGREIKLYRYQPGASRAGNPTVFDMSREMGETNHAGTDAMHDDFIRCVQGRLEPLTAGKVMVESVRMCTAGQEAVRTRQIIAM
jgi:predicted dehydrogenase